MFSYNLELTREIDQVRFLSGDTNENSHFIEDEEITFALTQEGNVRGAAALLLEHLAGRFSSAADKSVGPFRLSYSSRAKSYADRASALRQRGITIFAVPSAGGISIDGKSSRQADTDRVRPAFTRDMMENTEEGTS